MIFQIILTASLLGIGFYAIVARRRSPLVGNLVLLVIAMAIFFVWRPEAATWVANQVGIGRGSDLIFYCWVILSLLLILNLHIKLRSHTAITTSLIRTIALMNPKEPKTAPGKL